MNCKKLDIKSKLKLENILLILIIILGVSFTIFQYLYNRSLWLDETYLSLNIINRSFFGLLEPLDYEQVAPILFLYIEKLATILFGPSEYALRLFPLFSYLASIFFFYKTLKSLKLNVYVIIFSISLFIFNGTVIYYSSEVKQYTTDVMVITYMFYFTIKNQESLLGKYMWLGILGVISIFLTNVSPIILLCCGTYLLYMDFKNGWKEVRNIVKLSIVWIAAFGIYYIFFIYHHPTREFMVHYWTYWGGGGGFLHLNPFKKIFYLFIIGKYNSFYTELFQFGNIGFFSLQLLFILGCYTVFEKKKYKIVILGILPILIHLALSSLKLYPFETRLILYTIPAFIIVLSYGFEYFLLSIKSNQQTLLRIAFVILIVPLLIYNVFSMLPVKCDEPRESFQYISQKMEKGDIIFASHYSKFPLMYYVKISQVDFSDNEIVMQEYGEFEDFEEDIAPLKGRVWFIFKDLLEYKNRDYIKEKYEDENQKLLVEYHANEMTVLLYEIAE